VFATTLFGYHLENLSCRRERGLLARDLLKSAHYLVAIGGIEFDQSRPAASPFRATSVVPEPRTDRASSWSREKLASA
jgi:hypothetical protein